MADYFNKFVNTRTENLQKVGEIKSLEVENLGRTASTIHRALTEPIIMTLADAWVGIGLVRPATTDDAPRVPMPSWMRTAKGVKETNRVRTHEHIADRFDYSKLWYMKLGEYYLPLSQTYTLKAKKKLNVSSLVDGIDIIQQTRKEAKTIDCVLRIGLRDEQDDLKIVDEQNQLVKLSQFLQELYETDAVFEVDNATINGTFGVTHAILTEYRFIPRPGMMTYTFEFSLTEVIFGDNVLTFNLRELTDDTGEQV